MKTVRNTSKKALRVPLPQGRKLHLGPGRSGQVSDHAVDHPPFAKLLEAGEIEIVEEGSLQPGSPGAAPIPGHPQTHGHHPAVSAPRRGDRGG
jgi:hypothetical protein